MILGSDLFQTLAREHRLILRVLAAFERFIASGEKDKAMDCLKLGRFVTFFREYVDLIHHEREEQLLFPILTGHDFTDKYGPLAHIREQHGKERNLLWSLMRAFVERDLGDGDGARDFRRSGMEYVRFQRAHIEKERSLFYPAASRELTPSDQRSLALALARFEKDPHRAQGQWLEELGESLAKDRPAVASETLVGM